MTWPVWLNGPESFAIGLLVGLNIGLFIALKVLDSIEIVRRTR